MIIQENGEILFEGWDEIAGFFNVSVSTMIDKHKDELQAGGWIWYKTRPVQRKGSNGESGDPPRKVVLAWKSSLQRWIAIKTSKGLSL